MTGPANLHTLEKKGVGNYILYMELHFIKGNERVHFTSQHTVSIIHFLPIPTTAAGCHGTQRAVTEREN